MLEKAVDLLLEVLSDTPKNSAPITILQKKLAEIFQKNGYKDVIYLVDEAIEDALNTRCITKVIDYPDENDGLDTLRRTWFLRTLKGDEANYLRNLPEVKYAFLQLLRKSDSKKRIGSMREDIILTKLMDMGYDIDSIPVISGMVDIFCEFDGDETIVWHYLIPQDELSEEHQQMMEEQDRRHSKKQEILMQAAEEDGTEFDDE